jgi:threonine/homoserine/homoserine lactone efflux protein
MDANETFTLFDGLIWAGVALSLLGVAGLVWCVVTVWRARRAQLDDSAMRAVLQRVLPRNLGALFLSVIGLMLVIVGIFLS